MSKLYNIILAKGSTIQTHQLSSYSIHKYINEFLDDGFDMISIIVIPKEKHINKEVQKYYKAKYSQMYNLYKND